jgi:hypothetical protein
MGLVLFCTSALYNATRATSEPGHDYYARETTKRVISDNYFSATVVSNKEKDLGHLLFKHLITLPAATAAAATATTFYICLDRPLSGAPLGGLPVYSTHNTAPVSGVWELSLRRTFYSGSLWFSVVPHIELSRVVLCGRDTSASSSVTKIPATSTSRPRAPCSG